MVNTPLKSRPARPLTVPTAAEMRLLQLLWDLQEGTVEDVVNAHGQKERPNYKTTQTLLRIMEKKRFIAHEARGSFRIQAHGFPQDDRSFVRAGAGIA